MKKWICMFLTAMLCTGFPLAAAAENLTGCIIGAEQISGRPGETVEVAFTMEENPGFTNFAIALDYDREHLILKGIQTQNGEEFYLCGDQISINPHWDGAGMSDSGFIVAASAEPVRGDGILFTAIFEIMPGFTGEAWVSPIVHYVRNNEALFSFFEEISPSVVGGGILSVLPWDLTGDGMVEYDDVMLAYRAYLGETELTPKQLALVDENENGIVDESEYQSVYRAYLGG